MALSGQQAYALSRKYTADSLDGVGAIKGAPCVVKSKTSIDGGTRVVLGWTSTSGVESETTLDIMDGTDGVDGKGIYATYIVGETPFTSDWLSFTDEGEPLEPVANDVYLVVSEGDYENIMYRWNGEAYIPISSSGGGAGGSLTRELVVSSAVGGIKVGDIYESGDSIEDLLHDMLDPVAYPTLTNPSLSLAGSGSKLLETGATLAVTLTATFNRGSINPAYGTSGYRSGVAQSYALNGGTSQSGNTWSQTVSANNRTFSATCDYAAGEQPKDSKGNNYSSPLPAGTATSGNVVYDFVDAMWANTANITTVAKLSLIAKSAKQRDMVFPAQTIVNPEIFDIPASWTVTAVQVKNDLSGQYEDAADQFTVTDTTHNDAAGNLVAYKRYTFNKGFDTGARTVRVKWL